MSLKEFKLKFYRITTTPHVNKTLEISSDFFAPVNLFIFPGFPLWDIGDLKHCSSLNVQEKVLFSLSITLPLRVKRSST